MIWCEANGVDFVLGLAKNKRLKTLSALAASDALLEHLRTGKAARVFAEFTYRTRDS
jgi:hypothetical protein